MDNSSMIYNEIKKSFNAFYNQLVSLIKVSRDYSKFNHKLIVEMTDALFAINQGIVITKDIHKSRKINYKFEETLVNLLNALKAGDDVYCADLLIYEVQPEIELWEEVFNKK